MSDQRVSDQFSSLTDQELDDLYAVADMAAGEGVWVAWIIAALVDEHEERQRPIPPNLRYWANSQEVADLRTLERTQEADDAQ